MKHLFSVLIAGFCCLAGPLWGANTAPVGADKSPTLAIVVVETLTRNPSTNDDYDRIAEEFENAFTEKRVPYQVKVERFAANNEPHAYELRVFYRGIDDEFGEKIFRAWMTLTIGGTKHNFGIVNYRYWPRPGENIDDVVRTLFRGAGAKAADLVTPHLTAPVAK